MPVKMDVKLSGANTRRVLKNLDDELYADAWRRALVKGTKKMFANARARAPRGETNQLLSNLEMSVDARKVPLWGKVDTHAERGGFRYGWALQGSKRIKYRNQSGARKGKLTKSWLSGALGGIRSEVNKDLDTAARQIEAKWRA